METPKSSTLLIIARIFLVLTIGLSGITAFAPPIGGQEFRPHPYTWLFVTVALTGLVVLIFLSKQHRKISGVMMIGCWLILVIQSLFDGYGVTGALILGCLTSPPLIAGILLYSSGQILSKGRVTNTLPSTSAKEGL